MTDIWDERKRGLEEDSFHRKDRELLQMRLAAKEGERHQEAASPYCPKCGEELEEILFPRKSTEAEPGVATS